jgi:hypothetical protein
LAALPYGAWWAGINFHLGHHIDHNSIVLCVRDTASIIPKWRYWEGMLACGNEEPAPWDRLYISAFGLIGSVYLLSVRSVRFDRFWRFHGESFRLGSQRLGSTRFGSYGSGSCGSTVRLLTTMIVMYVCQRVKTMMVRHYWTIAFVAIRFTIMLSGTIILMMSIIK